MANYLGDVGGTSVYGILPRPPAPTRANPGPPPRGSYSGQRSSAGSAGHPVPPPKPPPNIFAGYVGPEVDAATQIVQQFMALMGFPSGLDANQLTLQILQQGLTSDSLAAMTYLFDSGQGVTQDARNAHPWAQFGLDATTFHNRADSIDSLFTGLIGQDPQSFSDAAAAGTLQGLYYQALKGNWSQTQIMQHLQNDASFADLRQAQPWLAAGQGEQQAQQQFASLYGSAPVDTPTLASWFRFNTGTQQLNRNAVQATMTAAPTPGLTTSR